MDEENRKLYSLPPNYVSFAMLQERHRKKMQEEERQKSKEEEKTAENKQKNIESSWVNGESKEYVRPGYDQRINRSGYIQRKPFERKESNYRDEGKSGYVAKGWNSSRGSSGNNYENQGRDYRFWGKSGGEGGNSGENAAEKKSKGVMSVEEEVRSGLQRNGGDGYVREERKKESQEWGKKVNDRGLVIGRYAQESSNWRGRHGGYKGVWVKKETEKSKDLSSEQVSNEIVNAKSKDLSLEPMSNGIDKAREENLKVEPMRGRNYGREWYGSGFRRYDDYREKKIEERKDIIDFEDLSLEEQRELNMEGIFPVFKGGNENGVKLEVEKEKNEGNFEDLSLEEVRAKKGVNMRNEGISGVKSENKEGVLEKLEVEVEKEENEGKLGEEKEMITDREREGENVFILRDISSNQDGSKRNVNVEIEVGDCFEIIIKGKYLQKGMNVLCEENGNVVKFTFGDQRNQDIIQVFSKQKSNAGGNQWSRGIGRVDGDW